MIRVVLADDHQIVREGLKALLAGSPGLQFAAEAANGREAVRLVLELQPEIALLDIAMPELSGIDATREIVAAGLETRVVLLSMHADRRYVTHALEAGADGYLLKDCALTELETALHTVMGGQPYLSPAVARIVISGSSGLDAAALPRSSAQVLSEREAAVLARIAQGHSTKQIAGQLFVSPKTVETHRARIMAKLGLFSIAELTKYAVREGLSPLDR